HIYAVSSLIDTAYWVSEQRIYAVSSLIDTAYWVSEQ
nr:hypothetical protein [Tanacetum cinerariifolium]